MRQVHHLFKQTFYLVVLFCAGVSYGFISPAPLGLKGEWVPHQGGGREKANALKAYSVLKVSKIVQMNAFSSMGLVERQEMLKLSLAHQGYREVARVKAARREGVVVLWNSDSNLYKLRDLSQPKSSRSMSCEELLETFTADTYSFNAEKIKSVSLDLFLKLRNELGGSFEWNRLPSFVVPFVGFLSSGFFDALNVSKHMGYRGTREVGVEFHRWMLRAAPYVLNGLEIEVSDFELSSFYQFF